MDSTSIYSRFHDTDEGKDAIGGTTTIELLQRVCAEIKPKTVLELGGGKGTLTYTVLMSSDATVDVYEPVEKFQERMRTELAGLEDRYNLIPSFYSLPPKRSYDLIIVDGGKKESEGAFPKLIGSYITSLDSVGTIIIEGQRKSQRYWAVEALWQYYIYTPTKYTDPHNPKKGALRLDCIRTSGKFKKFLNHWRNRKRIY